MPAHPCGRDARAPMRARCPCTRAVRRASGALLRRWVSNASATFNTRRRDRAHRAPMRAGRPRTHASGTPAHPCERDARAPMRAGRPRAHAGKMPAHPCGQDARAPMRAGRPRTRAARSSIMLNCVMCDVLFGWRVAPGASCTDTEGCAVSEHRRLRRYSVVSGARAKRSATRKVMSGRQAKAT
jgi:hypothetical protein